jgi:hypothetical protein
MSDHELIALLIERLKEIAREAVREIAPDRLKGEEEGYCAAAKLREQIAFIKAKEHVTIKEAALLLSCSESHVRKLVKLALKGKSRRPIPSVDMEGVTVFPLSDLLAWASPQPQPQAIQDKNMPRRKAA